MSTNQELDHALKALRANGHTIGEAAVDADGVVVVAIDGKMARFDEIYEMFEELKATPPEI